jgi:hypothetical protein
MMLLKCKNIFFCLLTIVLFGACEKEYSYEGGGTISAGSSSGTAVFSYNGGSGICTNAIIAGTYTAGTAVTSGNVVVVAVNVTVAGTYTISTATVNGMSFSASGSFTATGAQTIQLTASGTPIAAGTFVYTPGANGCSFSIVVSAAGGGGSTTSFITCKVDGVSKTFNIAINKTNTGIGLTFDGDENTTTATPNFSIGLTNGGSAVVAGSYAPGSLTNLTKICTGSYDDGVATTNWNTPLLASSNPFTVVVTSISATQVSGTFSGNLFSQDGLGTDVKVITDGVFTIVF